MDAAFVVYLPVEAELEGFPFKVPMELAIVTGAYVYGAAGAHMNPAATGSSNTTFGATDRGGQLMINYWYPGAPTGASTPAKSKSVNGAAWARWYLNLGN